MNTIRTLSVVLVAVAVVGTIPTALADTASASCEVRKDGNKWQGASGPCSFSQRQGYVNLDLRNGDSYSLTPTGAANHFKDQRGNKVVRTQAAGDQHVYTWEGGKKITVTFESGGQTAAAGSDAREDSYESACGVFVEGKPYNYRCRVTDYYEGGHKARTTLVFPDQTLQLTWKSADRVGLQFEGMVPKEARYSNSEGETNFVFENKTYFYFTDKDRARMELKSMGL